MILLTDGLFPSKYARWRIEEIKAFIDRGDTDILVSKVTEYDGISYGVDYEEMRDYFKLHEYNILIFDPKFNFLDKYNSKIQGSRFNNTLRGYSYLFTKSINFDVNNYKCFYHIFLSNYNRFKIAFPRIPDEQQFIHLYPGGGYSSVVSSLANVPRRVNLICTQPDSYKRALSLKFENCAYVYGSTSLPKDFVIKRKKKNTSTLRVCFSTMGNSESKGGNLFTEVAETYKKLHPTHDVRFYFVGTTFRLTKKINNIEFVPPMSQKELSRFYNDSIDVLVSCETGKMFNGWPLGIDAALQGSVLIGTDTHNRNEQIKYTEDMMFVVPPNSYLEIVGRIERLYSNRTLLQSMSNNIQDYSVQLFSYENQQSKIFSFIKNSTTTIQSRSYRILCPSYSYENCSYTIKDVNKSLMDANNLNLIDKDFPQLLIDSVKYKKGITMARYNDGEWIAMLRIKDHSLYEKHFPKWDSMGQQFVDYKLFPIINNRIDYYIGIASEVMKKDYMTKHMAEYLKGIKLFDGGLFARMSLEGSMKSLVNEIRNRNVIMIGPKYLKEMYQYFSFVHIETPEIAVWNQYNNIYKKALEVINETPEPVVIYACSFVAKVLIDNFYHQFGSSITQLDIGAAFDLYCGVYSRPWHKRMDNKL